MTRKDFWFGCFILVWMIIQIVGLLVVGHGWPGQLVNFVMMLLLGAYVLFGTLKSYWLARRASTPRRSGD